MPVQSILHLRNIGILFHAENKVGPGLTNEAILLEDVEGSGCIDSRIIDLGTSGR
jgi:hypothetical protein